MFIKQVILAASAALVIGLPSSADPLRQIDCRSIQDEIITPRWLSMPMSRLVINPAGGYDFLPMKPPVANGFGPALPVNLAYWVGGDEPVKLPMFWSWQPSGHEENTSSGVVGSSIDLPGNKAVTWRDQDAISHFVGSGVQVTLRDKNFGHLAGTLTVDLDVTPFLLISVQTHGDSRWALKVNDGAQPVDTYLKGDTTDSGDFVFDIRDAGWHGKKTFTLKLFVIGQPGASIDCAALQCVGLSADFPTLIARKTLWAPHRIAAEAQSADLQTDLEASTYFADESTIAQLVHIRKSSGSLILRGYFPDGSVHWDSKTRTLALESGRLHAVIALNRPARWMGASPSCVRALTGGLDPHGTSGMWSIALDNVKANDDICVVARFAPGKGDAGSLVSQAAKMADLHVLGVLLRNRETAWNKVLARAPHPADFSLRAVKDRGVTPEQIMRAYYRAWVFLMANILPPMPENDYNYPQVTCGKPSLWAEGHPRSRASAQWESMIAMLFTTCIDPEATWSSFEGMMSLVDVQGTLGGEGLPSRHVQVAWTLYSETGNRERLRKCYPAIKRLLQWKIDDPRWIYKGLTPPGMKDIEFVFHDLIDMEYVRRITGILDMPDETRYWESQSQELAVKFRKWFWEKPGGSVYRIYEEQKDTRSAPDNSWSIPAIVLPPDILLQPERESLLRLFRGNVDPSVSFMIWNLNKYPSLGFTMRGALQYGLVRETNELAEAIMRDTTASGEFSESYDQSVYPPRASGVTPSVNGAANVIDSTLLHNGVMCTDGLPIIAHMPNASGVGNLSIRGERIGVSFDKTGDGVTISGKGLRHLRLPDGFRIAKSSNGGQRWRGSLAVGRQLSLRFAAPE